MLRVQVQLLAGRYHATPWGRHVNEGDIEWPPSPWRLCRALLATGFAKQGWSEVPAQAAAAIEAMATVPPRFYLPPATSAHTRHYMPVYKGSTSKVIDAFAYPGRDLPLYIEWDVDLPEDQARLVDDLFQAMAYLGRAESWIQARCIDAIPGHDRQHLVPCAAAEQPPGPGYERVDLLAPMHPAHYAPWHEQALGHALDRRLAEKQQAARDKDKKPPARLTKKDRESVESMLPRTLVESLCAGTVELQRAGWSQPPGSRRLSYWRAPGSLQAESRPRRAPQQRRELVDTAILAVTSDTRRGEVLPHLHQALWQGERLHKTLVKHSDRDGTCAPCLTGRGPDGAPLQGHRHVTIVPLSIDHPGHIDHFLLHAPMGFDPAAVDALHRVRHTYGQNLPELFLTLIALGQRHELTGHIPALSAARVWTSNTPFVPPRHLKPRGNSSLAGQVRAELASRGLPAPAQIEIQLGSGKDMGHIDEADFWPLWHARRPMVRMSEASEGEPTDPVAAGPLDPRRADMAARILGPWRHFRRRRNNAERKAPMAAAFGLRLVFDQPVSGPLCLGYASHYGLGMFIPEKN